MRRAGLIVVMLLFAAATGSGAPRAAEAATVVNGDFEAGSLKGWSVSQATEAGNWFAYDGTKVPPSKKLNPQADPVQAPPQGRFAALSDQVNPDQLILYQDIALEAGQSHLLSLLAYYDSDEPIAVPSPDSFSVDEDVLLGQANQQFRIDVVRPEAPLDSLAPGDLLATLFATRPGSPARMKPTRFSADLSAFAGQTVRLRIAVIAHEEVLNASVDAVALDGDRGQGAQNRTRLGFGKVRANRNDGSVVLPVWVPGPGLLGAVKKPIVKAVTVKAWKAETKLLRLRPAATTLRRLERRGRVRIRIPVTYMPAGEPSEVATATVVLRLGKG